MKARLACLALILIFNAVKFVRLNADFPPGVTSSRVLYTDEGWYSTQAVNHATDGSWYSAGELNTMVSLPVAPLLQAGVFRLLGVGLTSARALVALFSIVLVGGAFLWAQRLTTTRVATLLALLLSANFFLFAYSRLATLDVIAAALTVMALTVASRAARNRSVLVCVAAGAVLGVAALTKTTALCALPALSYLAGVSAGHERRRWLLACSSAGACVVVVGLYSLVAWTLFPVDFGGFAWMAVGFDLASRPFEIVRNGLTGGFHAARDLSLISVAALCLTTLQFTRTRAFGENVLVRASILWILGFIAMLSLVSYQPSRYVTMIEIPILALIAVAVADMKSAVVDRRAAFAIQQLVIGSIVLVNAVEIAAYLARPKFTFDNMARDVAGIVGEVAGTLVGDMSSSLTLATGVRSMNLTTGTADLPTRLRRHCPTHFITLQQPEEIEAVTISANYALEHVQDWNVFNNYYGGRRVQLYRLHPRGELAGHCASRLPALARR